MLDNSLPWFLTNPDPDIFLSENYVVVDFETTNKDKGDWINPDNKIVLAAWYTNKTRSLDYKWGNEYEQRELVEACEKADFIVAHNTKFELGWLERCGLALEEILPYDTLLGAYVHDGNRHRSRDLDSLCNQENIGHKESLVSKLIKGGVCPSEIPGTFLQKYCLTDVELTNKLFRIQRVRLKEENKLKTQFTRCIFTPVLVEMEKKGMCLDKGRVKEQYEKDLAEYNILLAEIEEFTGGINPNSPKQMAEFLYDRLGFSELKDYRGNPLRTGKNGRRTDKETIVRLKASNKQQRRFVELKKRQSELNGNLTKYLTKFEDCCEQNDGILQFNFNQTITKTHRLSSNGKRFKIQGQNLNRNYKPLFKARYDEWVVGEIDGAQLEFRVAAFLGQDARAMQDIREGADVHAFTASVLNQCLLEEVTGEWRQDAKSDTFKPLYGGSSGTKRQQEYYTAFREKYPGITGAQEQWKQEVLNTKKLVTCTGLEFFWPDTKLTSTGYITNSTSICNYPVQSFATADIIPIAVTYQYHRMIRNKLRSFLVNTIHDSSIGEVHPDEVIVYKDIGFKAFTDDVYFYLERVYQIDFNVGLGAEYKWSPHWSDKAEIKQGLGAEEKI